MIGTDQQAGGDQAPAMGAEIPAELLAQLVTKTREADRLKVELAGINQELGSLKAQMLELFMQNGLQQLKTDDGATVFVAKRSYYSVALLDGEMKAEAELRVAAALEEAGLGHLVAHPTVIDLAAVATEVAEREAEANEESGADLLGSLFKTANVYDLKVRRR